MTLAALIEEGKLVQPILETISCRRSGDEPYIDDWARRAVGLAADATLFPGYEPEPTES